MLLSFKPTAMLEDTHLDLTDRGDIALPRLPASSIASRWGGNLRPIAHPVITPHPHREQLLNRAHRHFAQASRGRFAVPNRTNTRALGREVLRLLNRKLFHDRVHGEVSSA
jgi:hypothetical protein